MQTPLDRAESLYELNRKIENRVRLGQTARCHLRTGGLLSNWVPFFSLRAGRSAARTWWLPLVGEQCMLLCPGRDLLQGVALAGLFSDTAPQGSEQEGVYPTKNSLKGWYREYQQRQDLPGGYAGREPKFPQAQKAAALKHYLTHDRCIAATMRALGYPGRGTLTKWIREAIPEAGKAIVGRVGPGNRDRSLRRWYSDS